MRSRNVRYPRSPPGRQPDPEDSIRIIHKAFEAGINLVDTAEAIDEEPLQTAPLGDPLSFHDVLSDEVLDRIDEIVPPGTDIGPFDQAQA